MVQKSRFYYSSLFLYVIPITAIFIFLIPFVFCRNLCDCNLRSEKKKKSKLCSFVSSCDFFTWWIVHITLIRILLGMSRTYHQTYPQGRTAWKCESTVIRFHPKGQYISGTSVLFPPPLDCNI